MTAAAEAMAPHVRSDRGACLHCGQPAHTTGRKTAVHTDTGMFSCQNGGGFAQLWSADEMEGKLQEAYENGTDDAQDGINGQVDDARWEGYDEGRDEMAAEVRAAIAELRKLHSGPIMTDVLNKIEDVTYARRRR